MWRSKYFWIAVVVLVPFFVVWIMYGLAWAIGMVAALATLFFFALGATRRPRRRYIIYDDDEDEEIVILEKGRQRRSGYSERIKDLYFPKGLRNIHQDGLNELGKMQREDLNRTLRRLRRLR